METPLVLSGREQVQLQVCVSEPEEAGQRRVEIYSRLQRAEDGAQDVHDWTRHASGLLGALENAVAQEVHSADAGSLAGAWPPDGAEPAPVEELYDRMAGVGVAYGPTFLAVKAIWRRGDELFAEVSLPEQEWTRAGCFHIHPALLDAALHVSAVHRRASGRLEIPFAWSGVSVRAAGASSVRACISPTTTGGVSLTATNEAGEIVLSVRSLVIRAVTSEQLERAAHERQDSLFCVDWVAPAVEEAPAGIDCALVGERTAHMATSLASAGGSASVYEDLRSLGEAIERGVRSPEVVLVDCTSQAGDGGTETDSEGDTDERMRCATQTALTLIQQRLDDPRLSESRLVLLTREAVAVRPGEGVDGLAQAGLWGLARSAQTESPGCLLLVDLDNDRGSWESLPGALRAALTLGEPQLAIRQGEVLAPRLAPAVRAGSSDGQPAEEGEADAVALMGPDPRGTVLVTGGTGGLGRLVARHLVARHEVRHLLLASRRGLAAEGAGELVSEFEQMGAHVSVAACDVADRNQLQALLSAVPEEHPLCAVVHIAGVVEDGMLGSLTPEQVDRVLDPKVAGAWHLHSLTEDLDLSAFVLFSSATGVLGGMGQSNYAAANAFLDALAAYRRARGLAGISLAWGPWNVAGGMTGQLNERDSARVVRSGAVPMSERECLDLFDVAYRRDEPLLVPLRLDRSALGSQAGALPAMLRGLARSSGGRVKQLERGVLERRLAAAPKQEHQRILLDAVRVHAATVLGHASPQAIEEAQPFKELGFDSLASIELRNRLSQASGVSLPATLIFDYPTPRALAGYLLDKVAPDGARAEVRFDAELDRLERLLATASAEEVGSKVKLRLQAILAGLDRNGERAGEAAVAEKMHSASADEVFDFIETELRSK
jgi:NAD(P)-dependent dehydrogenase (short-subunit alcohol dehydrogenase family)/acyl carrier protein